MMRQYELGKPEIRLADLLVQQSQTDLYEKTHIVAKPYKGTP